MAKPKTIIIAALDADYVIGTATGLPWEVPSDYAQYLDFVKDQTVIMGRKTWELFCDDLESKNNLVVSGSYEAKGDEMVFDSLEKAVDYAQDLGRDVFIAGGASIYKETLERNFARWMYLSWIPGKHKGTVYFPDYDKSVWHEKEREENPSFTFVVYKRKGPNGI